jgi:adenosylmethionine-8-amino-7-oxononanoate aminotransferase
MNYEGLIPEVQKPVEMALPHWRYGTIQDGVRKIDPLLHYGCFTLGFEQPKLVEKVCDVVKNIKPEIAEVVGYGDLRLNQVAFQLQEEVYKLSGGYNSFYALSGSDANEGAVKLASAYHYQRGNHQKKQIVSLKPSYHGSTYLTSSIGCDSLMEDPFYTMRKPVDIIRVDRKFNIHEGLVNWSTVSAVVVETCTYADTMEPYSDDFWNKLAQVQQKHDVLIIIDDIFMGGGKTGHYCGWNHLPIRPDIATMGKAITGGFFPLSMTLYNKKVKDSLPSNFKWEHGFTYNFSIAGIVSALEYNKLAIHNNLINQVSGLVARAEKTFTDCGFEILNNFGTFFMVRKVRFQSLYMIPLNADEMYFEVLRKELITL